jgi:tripartite-type tricarboxylate transporter receptor subunit TctC
VRVEAIKEIPTFKEQGFDAGDVSTWEGAFAPKGTPPDVIKILESAIEMTAKDEAVIAQFKKFFQRPSYLPGSEFRKVLADEDVRVKALVQELKLAPEK